MAQTGVLEKSGRLASLSPFERSITPKSSDVLTSFSSKQRQVLSATLSDDADYFPKLIAKEPFVGRPISAYVGFMDLPAASHQKMFSGIVSEIRITPGVAIELQANEG
jgi:hypothetical protein